MKILKYLAVVAIVVFSSCTQAQNTNKLTIVEYNSVKINGVNIVDIDGTKGDITKMNTLFGFSFAKKTNTEPSLRIGLWNNVKGIYFEFQDGTDIGNNYSIYSYGISNNQSNITIKGKTITIGDSIDKLGSVKISNTNEIDFGTDQTSDVLTIKFNTVTKKIVSIEYTYFD